MVKLDPSFHVIACFCFNCLSGCLSGYTLVGEEGLINVVGWIV